MADLILFRIRNRFFYFANFYHNLLLYSFALFLIAGNFFRLFPLAPFPSHISIAETLFYALSLPIYFSRLRKSQFFIVGIALSSLYGTLLHGLDISSVLYACKLIAGLAGGYALGEVLFKKFQGDFQKCMQYFLRLFLWTLLLGGVILIFFPKAQLFFNLLQNYGIHFSGDPHQRRFISPFFDPNYYSAIACIPLILAWLLRRKILFFFFLVSIFLSFSRSGIATCVALLFCMGSSQLIHYKIVRIRSFFLYSFMAIAMGILLSCYSNELYYFFSRFLHMQEDPSAHARLVSFTAGLDYFWNYPFFGVGYHYLSKLLEEGMGFFSPDSSMLIVLVDFGLIPLLALLFTGVYWSINQFKKRPPPLFAWLYIYLLICISFTAQFNNLLFYQYWLIPMIALFTYIGKNSHESRICT